MRLRCRRFFILLIGFASPVVLAQQSAPPPASSIPQRDPQAVATLKQCAAAMGSPSAELSVIAQGNVKIATEPESYALTIKSRGAHLFLSARGGPTGPESVLVRNGTGFGTRSNQREALASHTTRFFRPDHLPAFSCTPDLSKFVVTSQDFERVLERPAIHLKLVASATNPRTKDIEALLSEFHIYIDQETYVVLKTSTFIFSPTAIQNHSTWDTYYGDYRRIGGVLTPFHVENYLSGQKIRDITFSDVQVGVSLSDADFE